MTETVRHTSHAAITNRLKRAQGHLTGVIAMIESGRGCTDIAQQLLAVESAIRNAKRALIQDHIDHCLNDLDALDPDARLEALEDFKRISKYL